MNSMLKRALWIIAALAVIEGTLIIRQLYISTDSGAPKKVQCLTVFVHGTIQAAASTKDLYMLYHDKPDRSLYARRATMVRTDPFFYGAQPIQELGLKPIELEAVGKKTGSSLFAQLYNFTNQYASHECRTNNFYSYGWSGLLSNRERLEAAKKLYVDLQKEVKRFRKLGIETKINLVGYSHGGTVCLNLADILLAHEEERDALTIDTLILLGTPITTTGNTQIHSPRFKKIYNIYSRSDRVQTADFISTVEHVFPRRIFTARKKQALPKNLKQIAVYLHSYEIKNKRVKEKMIEPDHIELWFFGWGRDAQRTLPISNMPVAVFIPNIIETADKLDEPSARIDISRKKDMLKFRASSNNLLKQPISTRMPYAPLEALYMTCADCVPADYQKQYKAKRKRIDRSAKATATAPLPIRPRDPS